MRLVKVQTEKKIDIKKRSLFGRRCLALRKTKSPISNAITVVGI
jgi:hypothetical protein